MENGVTAADSVGRTGVGARGGSALVQDVVDGPANELGETGGSEGDVCMRGKGKAVHTPEVADLESAVGLQGRGQCGRDFAELETRGLGQQGVQQRPQRREGGG